jgi:2'-5' RNA ligase
MAIRCFIAIEIPEAIRKAVTAVTDSLKNTGADVKWVSDENIHITLQFLGETEESLIPKIKDTLDKILAPYSPFYIKMSHIGCFPDGRHPRVIWVGIEECRTLINLHNDITNAMAEFGYPKEDKEFTAHGTIGRVKSQKNSLGLRRRLDEIKTAEFSGFEVNSITLMKSELKSSGAKYYSLAEIPFGRRSNVNEGSSEG